MNRFDTPVLLGTFSTLALTPIWLVYASLSTEISDLEGEVVLFCQIPIGDI